MQIVELHFAAPPALNLRTLHARAEAILGESLDSPGQDEAKQYPVLKRLRHGKQR